MENQAKIIYKKVGINDEIIAGELIKTVYSPTPESPTWRIVLVNNIMIEATGAISVWTKEEAC